MCLSRPGGGGGAGAGVSRSVGVRFCRGPLLREGKKYKFSFGEAAQSLRDRLLDKCGVLKDCVKYYVRGFARCRRKSAQIKCIT